MNEVIQRIGKPPMDVLFELLENNRGSVPTVYFHHSEEDMRYALSSPSSRSAPTAPRSPPKARSTAIRIPATSEPSRACSAATCAMKK